jgi:ADP-heptose:LPS heptosyltransferase
MGLLKSGEFDDIHIFVKHIELVSHISGVTFHHSDNVTSVNLDLTRYTARRPHNNLPYRASYLHMLEMAEESLGVTLPIIPPSIPLSDADNSFAIQKVSGFTKPLIWFQSRTTSTNRNWRTQRWSNLIKNLSNVFDLIDLSHAGYSLLQSLAITKHSFGGICLDSFLVHGSAAVGARNVIVLAGSSRGECITYPGQELIYEKSDCIAQPCGMHGYYPGCRKEHEYLFLDRNCIHRDSFCCMNKISLTHVEERVRGFLEK